MNIAYYNNRAYTPVQTPVSGIVGDNPVLAAQGDRLMFSHGRLTESHLFIAPKNIETAGFVLGVFLD